MQGSSRSSHKPFRPWEHDTSSSVRRSIGPSRHHTPESHSVKESRHRAPRALPSASLNRSRIEGPRTTEGSIPIAPLEPMGIYIAQFIWSSIQDARPEPAVILPKGPSWSTKNDGAYLLLFRLGTKSRTSGSSLWLPRIHGSFEIIKSLRVKTALACYCIQQPEIRQCYTNKTEDDAEWWISTLKTLGCGENLARSEVKEMKLYLEGR